MPPLFSVFFVSGNKPRPVPVFGVVVEEVVHGNNLIGEEVVHGDNLMLVEVVHGDNQVGQDWSGRLGAQQETRRSLLSGLTFLQSGVATHPSFL